MLEIRNSFQHHIERFLNMLGKTTKLLRVTQNLKRVRDRSENPLFVFFQQTKIVTYSPTEGNAQTKYIFVNKLLMKFMIMFSISWF